MQIVPLRLVPGQDLRRALEEHVAAAGCTAAFVLSGIGSLVDARLRLAGAGEARTIAGDVEILSLAGTIGADGSHLHAALAGADGEVVGGHVAPGCRVRTTAEVLLALLPEWHFTRPRDEATGFAELAIRARAESPG
jgi:uncharacterized protein